MLVTLVFPADEMPPVLSKPAAAKSVLKKPAVAKQPKKLPVGKRAPPKGAVPICDQDVPDLGRKTKHDKAWYKIFVELVSITEFQLFWTLL